MNDDVFSFVEALLEADKLQSQRLKQLQARIDILSEEIEALWDEMRKQ